MNAESPGPWRGTGAEFWSDLDAAFASRCERYRMTSEPVDEELRQLVLEQITEQLRALIHAVPHGDEMATRAAAHVLKGIGGTVGLPEISAVGECLSEAARAGDWPRCRAFYERLASWLALNRGEGSFGCSSGGAYTRT